jgi:hypothetical protein
MLTYHATSRVENVHPLDGGLFRRKYRLDRRPGTPVESRWVFYPRYWWESFRKQVAMLKLLIRYDRAYRRAVGEPASTAEDDVAMRPALSDEFDSLELYNATGAARRVAANAKQTAALRATRSAA